MIGTRTYLTTGERTRTFLLVSFVLSLIANALLTLVYPNLHRVHERVTPHTITITHLIMHPRPTPRPTPKPLQQPHPRPIARLVRPAVRTPRLPVHHDAPPAPVAPIAPPAAPISAGDGDSLVSAPIAGPTAVATATAPACAVPNAEARVRDAVSPDYPDSARELGLGEVSVLVRVTIGTNGGLIDAAIAQSSGNAAIDDAALRAARASTYAAKIVDCAPVQGAYIFDATFTP
jgi:protein TonB